MNTFVCVFGLRPIRIGGMEALVRQTASVLGERGWKTVAVFPAEPVIEVRRYLDHPDLSIKTVPNLDTQPLRALLALHRILGAPGVRCVHFHFTGLQSPAYLAAALHGVPCYYTVHTSLGEDKNITPAPAWKRAMVRLWLRPIDRVLCVSEFVRSWTETRGYFSPDQLYTVYNGVRLPDLHDVPALRSEYRLRHGIPEHAPVILQVGQVIDSKGVEDLLRAVPQVVSDFPDAQFVFVGEGAEEKQFRALSATLNIDHAVRWVGMDVDPCRSGAFAAADILCAPSRWQEAFGLSIAEAMSYALPVVATNTGGIKEVVIDGETGFLVDRRSPDQLAGRIRELLKSSALRLRMGNAGYQRADAVLNLRRTTRQLLETCRIPDARAGANQHSGRDAADSAALRASTQQTLKPGSMRF